MFYSKSTSGFYDTAIHGDNIPADAVEITKAEHTTLLAGQSKGKRIVSDLDGYPTLSDPEPLSAASIIAAIAAAVQSHLDAAAQSLGYDDIKTAVTYADEPAVPKFQADGQALRAWRSLVWAKCYEMLEEVKSGNREVVDVVGVIAELPMLVLPESTTND